MALSTATVTMDLSDLLGVDFDARRTKVWISTNVPNDTVIDTADNKIRLGSGTVTVSADGTASVVVWVPGGDANPSSWQTYIHVDYPDRQAHGGRGKRTFGPFTITASTDLADLVDEQEVPAEYVTTLTTALDGYVTEAANSAAVAQAAADSATAIVGIDTADVAVAVLVEDSGSETSAALSATFVSRNSIVIDAATFHPTARTQVQINQAIAAASALSTDATVLVSKQAGPWSIDRSDPAVQAAGGIVMQPGVALRSDGARLNLVGNTAFVKATSTLAPTSVTITANVVTTDTTLTLTSSASFTAGDDVFLRLGQAAYDAAEPDFWLYAKVVSVPNGTSITIDRPVGYALNVGSVATAHQKSVTRITTLMDDVVIEGDWDLYNSATDPANAESGIWLQYVPRARVGNIVAHNPGAGAVLAQFVDNLVVGDVKVTKGLAQNGHSAKGRAINFAEVRSAAIRSVRSQNFDGAAIVAEGRCEALTIDKVTLANTSTTRANTTTALVSVLGNSRMRINDLHLTGNFSYLADEGGTTGNSLRIGNFYAYTTAKPIIADLSVIEGDFYADGSLFTRRQRYTLPIPLTPNMSATVFNLPAGHLRRTRVYASTTTGITLFYLGSSAAVSSDQRPALVSGGTVALGGQGQGFGSGYNISNDTGKRVVITTDATVPAGAYLVVDVDYYATSTEPSLAQHAPTTTAAVGCSAFRSSSQSIPNGVDTLILLDSESFDSGGFHSTSTDTSRVTIPAGLGGMYVITGCVRFASNATGVRGLNLLKNGSNRLNSTVLASAGAVATGINATTVAYLAAGDYLEAQVYQNSGAALNTDHPSLMTSTSLSVVRVGT